MTPDHITFLFGSAEADRSFGMTFWALCIVAMIVACVIHVVWVRASAWWQGRRVAR
jgi:hypothetical protein